MRSRMSGTQPAARIICNNTGVNTYHRVPYPRVIYVFVLGGSTAAARGAWTLF
jgi:hypothetical protein